MIGRDGIREFELVELTTGVACIPAGARGGVLEFRADDVAVVEILDPELDGLDRIVDVPSDRLRAIPEWRTSRIGKDHDAGRS